MRAKQLEYKEIKDLENNLLFMYKWLSISYYYLQIWIILSIIIQILKHI